MLHPHQALHLLAREAFSIASRSFPVEFRHRYGQEMAEVYEDSLQAAWMTGGTLGFLQCVWAYCLDTTTAGLAERLEVAPRSIQAPIRRMQPMATAAAAGGLTSFWISHNPLTTSLFFLVPLAIAIGPFVGGMRAGRQAQLGFIGSLVAISWISLTTHLPILLLIPIIWLNQGLFQDTMTATAITTGSLYLWLALTAYSAVAATAGFAVQQTRDARRVATPA